LLNHNTNLEDLKPHLLINKKIDLILFYIRIKIIITMDNFQTYSQFLNYIECNYDEEQQIIIENFISYYINEYKKFGKYNCKDTYYDDLKSDTTGELHKLGVIGFEFEKKIHDERQYIKSLKKYKK